MTVVLITHHMEECIGADCLYVMAEGRIITSGTPDEVFSRVELMDREGLSVPESVRLLYELNREGYAYPLSALDAESCADVLMGSLN